MSIRGRSRTSLRLLFICLTGLLGAFPACRLLVNDLSDRQIPGNESVYNPTLKPGSASRALLSDRDFRRLVVEIQAVADHYPAQEAINSLQRFLEKTLSKPGGIEIRLSEPIPPAGNASLTIADVRAIEDRNRQVFSEKDRVGVYVLFLDAKASDTRGSFRMLGQAHRNTSIVIYEKTLRELAEAQGQNAATPLWVLEATIIQHEFGHLLGLVNLGAAPGQSANEDLEHPRHCSNPSCLMHFTSETPDSLAQPRTRPPELDAACEAALK